MISKARSYKNWIIVIFICVVASGISVYKSRDIFAFREYSDTDSDSDSGAGIETIVDQHNDTSIQKLLSLAFSFKTIHGSETESEEKKQRENPMINFVYSENEIRNYFKTIHLNTLRYVNKGEGPCIKRLPQCLIVGNFKCGTRELIDFMGMHPRIKIHTKPYYELEFFNKEYSRGLEWYRQLMPCSYTNQVTVEKSPSYFQSERAPERIHEMNSSIRIIVFVREPVARTLSQFTFFRSRYQNYSNLSLREAVCKNNIDEINEKSYFVRHSIYDEAMVRYLQYFKRDQIKVIHSDEFQTDSYTVLHDLETFLSLEHTIKRTNFVYNTKKGFHCIREDITSKDAYCYGDNRGRNTTEVQNSVEDIAEIIDMLKRFFKPHNDRFFKLIGRSFNW